MTSKSILNSIFKSGNSSAEIELSQDTAGAVQLTDHQMDSQGPNMADPRLSAMLSLVSLYIIITVVGFISNAAVLYMIVRSRRSKAVTSIYIFNLAIADLLYLVCLPAAVFPMLNGHWILGHIMCKLYFTCDGVSKFASVMFLAVLSFDRYMAVCHPIASRAVRTAKVAFVASGASWLLVILAMTPVFVYATLVRVNAGDQSSLQCVIYWPAPTALSDAVNDTDTETTLLYAAGLSDTLYPTGAATESVYGNLTNLSVSEMEHIINSSIQSKVSAGNDSAALESNFTGVYEFTAFVNLSGGEDWGRRIFTLYIFTLSFAAPLLLVWIFYIMIIHRLWTQKRNLFHSSASSAVGSLINAKSDECRLSRSERAMLPANRANQRRRRSTKRVTIMVLSIVVAYTVCWVPYWCVQMTIEFFREDPALDFEIFTIISYIAYGVQSINSALNPFLYAFGTHAHRRCLQQWLRRFSLFLGCDRCSICFGQRDSLNEAGIPRRQGSNVNVMHYRHDFRMHNNFPPSALVNGRQFLSTEIRNQLLNTHSGARSRSPADSTFSFSKRYATRSGESISNSENSEDTRSSLQEKYGKVGSKSKCCYKWRDIDKGSSENHSSTNGQDKF